MNAKITTAEQEIIDYVESNPASIANVENEKKRYQNIAQMQMNKRKSVQIKLLESDIEIIKAKSFSQGLSYQALISALVHQYAHGKIKLHVE
jgi:predicted DNA binding CopG/RHH family protein